MTTNAIQMSKPQNAIATDGSPRARPSRKEAEYAVRTLLSYLEKIPTAKALLIRPAALSELMRSSFQAITRILQRSLGGPSKMSQVMMISF